MKNLLVLNPQAGPKTPVDDELREAAMRAGVIVYVTNGEADLHLRVEELARSGGKRVIAAGGDGTVNRVLNAILERAPNLELAIVPVGTANDLARCLELERDDYLAALEFALTGEAISIDVVRIASPRGVYFANAGWGGFGMEEGETAEPEAKEKWGPFAYWMRAAAKVSDAAILDLTLTLDGNEVQLAAHGLAIANGRYLGGFPILPDAILDDGLLDVAAVRAQGSMEMLSVAVNTLLDRQKSDEKIFTARARNVQVRSATPLRLKFDGEPLESRQFDLALLPKAVRVVGGGEQACLGSNESEQ